MHSRICIKIYIFCFKKETQTHTNKQTNKQTNKKQMKLKKKREKQNKSTLIRRNKMLFMWAVSVKNLTEYHDIVWESALCTLTYMIESWISPGCSYCNEGNHSISYTIKTYEYTLSRGKIK